MNLEKISKEIKNKKGERVSRIDVSSGNKNKVKIVLNYEDGHKKEIGMKNNGSEFGLNYFMLSNIANRLIEDLPKNIDATRIEEFEHKGELNIPIYLLYENGRYINPTPQ